MISAASSVTVTAKVVCVPKVYMFGLAASFNDSIVHMTEIQSVDSAWLDAKNEILLGREQYSYQIRNYLNNNDMEGRTCIVFFDRKLSRLQKKYLKVKKLYIGNPKKKVYSHNDVRILTQSDFSFNSVNMESMVPEYEANKKNARRYQTTTTTDRSNDFRLKDKDRNAIKEYIDKKMVKEMQERKAINERR